MQVINKSDDKTLVIHAGYSEAHLMREALSLYRLRMDALNGKNSEEEKMIGELLHDLMNPDSESPITMIQGESK